MGWLRLVGSLKLLVSFAKEPYKTDDILQKRPIILRSLPIVATPYTSTHAHTHGVHDTYTYTYVCMFVCTCTHTRTCAHTCTHARGMANGELRRTNSSKEGCQATHSKWNIHQQESCTHFSISLSLCFSIYLSLSLPVCLSLFSPVSLVLSLSLSVSLPLSPSVSPLPPLSLIYLLYFSLCLLVSLYICDFVFLFRSLALAPPPAPLSAPPSLFNCT